MMVGSTVRVVCVVDSYNHNVVTDMMVGSTVRVVCVVDSYHCVVHHVEKQQMHAHHFTQSESSLESNPL
jgi:hypothetical protein